MNNTKTILRTLALGLLLVGVARQLPAQAVEESQPTTTVEAAAPSLTGYNERQFDQDKLDGYRKDAKYKYLRDKPEPPKRKPKPRKERQFSESRSIHYDGPRGDFSGLAKGILWVLIIGASIFVIAQMLKVNWKGLMRKKSDKAKVIAESEIPIEEDVTKMEFDDPLQKAIDMGNFRIAVRLLYLRTLRQLSDQSLIAWRKEKTNHDYLREIQDKSLRPAFSDVTLIFEYIWYGEFPVNKDDFNLARASFIHFEQTLRQQHAV